MRPQKMRILAVSFLLIALLALTILGQSSGPMDELTLGLQQRNQIFNSYRVIQNTRANEFSEQVFRSLLGTSIAKSAGRNVPWELTLLASDDVNAFSTAGGKVYVTSGMMERVLGLNYGLWASVLGHEIGHTLANHQYKAYTRHYEHELQRLNLQNLANQGQAWAQWALLAHMTAGKLAKLKVSRDDEVEADYLGLLMMAEAGVHPDYAAAMCRQMAAKVGDQGKVWTFFSSDHPRWATREENVWQAWDRAFSAYRARWSDPQRSPGGAPPPIVRMGEVKLVKDEQRKAVLISLPYLVRNTPTASIGVIFEYKGAKVPGALTDFQFKDGSLGIIRPSRVNEAAEFTISVPSAALNTKERKLDAWVAVWVDGQVIAFSKGFQASFPKP